MPERDDAKAGGLCHTAEIGDRNAGYIIDGLHAVELERVDDQVKAIGQLALFDDFPLDGINTLR